MSITHDISTIPEKGDIVKEVKFIPGYQGIIDVAKIKFESGKSVAFYFEDMKNRINIGRESMSSLINNGF